MNVRDHYRAGSHGSDAKEDGGQPSESDRTAAADQCASASKLADRQSQPLSVLRRLTSRELKLLLDRCSERKINVGAPLFTQAGPRTATFIVKSGLIRTYYSSPMGKEVTVGFWSTGDMAGGPHFFDEGLHLWSGKAVEDSVVWAIKGHDLQELSAKVPAIAECVIAALTFKLRWVSLLLQNMGTEHVSHRLAHLLVALSEMYGVKCDQGIRIRYAFTQEDLANMICATRQWVSMTFKRYQNEGIVRIEHRHLVILDMPALRRMVKQVPDDDGATGKS